MVGLLSSGQVSASLSGLFLDDPTLVGLDGLTPEARFDAAFERSPGFRALLAHALAR